MIKDGEGQEMRSEQYGNYTVTLFFPAVYGVASSIKPEWYCWCLPHGYTGHPSSLLGITAASQNALGQHHLKLVKYSRD